MLAVTASLSSAALKRRVATTVTAAAPRLAPTTTASAVVDAISTRSAPLLLLRRQLSAAAVGAAAEAPLPPPFGDDEKSYETMYMWGTDKKGSLLKPSDRQDETKLDVPARVDWRTAFGVESDDVKLRKVICGDTDTAWLLSDGSCYVAGENKQGQLGLGHQNPVERPIRVEMPDDQRTTDRIRDVALGSNSAAWIDDAGDLYTAGFGGSAFAGTCSIVLGGKEDRRFP